MKFDELDKMELESYPKNNIVIDHNPKKPYKKNKARFSGKGLNIALGLSILGAGVAVVTLGTSLISMAMNGVLGTVFKAMISL